ncbi:helix-turn-helix domain-containing protein [Pseudoalteromonas sp. G4]|uniref:helix-turn-helix domain-containing protein n=1 Tax=Pseudoalteromonas sp. G4 TaxID=2992761 RepID=UPI00237D3F35|nr:helix-turn-helix domain-containing protein [Pseudoalteromonas sp. G4]MDE3270468.1 helix-turn-helix domain-containing protein [Pseudoalteromonas sp. G4]
MTTRSYTFNSIDEYRRNLYLYGIDALQFSSGRLKVNNHTIMFSNMLLTHRKINRELMHFINSIGERLVIVVPCKDEKALVDGVIVGKSQLFVRTPFETGVTKFPENFCALHIELDLNALKPFFTDQQIKTLWRNLATNTIESVFTKDAADFSELALDVYHCAAKMDSALAVTEYKTLENIMLVALHDMLKVFAFKQVKQTINTRKNTVFRALKYLKGLPGNSISVNGLAERACCSKRTLEYAFKETLGCSPKQYLKIRKLHLIRDELKNSHNKSVKQVLTQFDEKNQARFASDYLVLFDEMPKIL